MLKRCGNANLASIIANLELKYGHTTVGRARLESLASVCRYIADLANLHASGALTDEEFASAKARVLAGE